MLGRGRLSQRLSLSQRVSLISTAQWQFRASDSGVYTDTMLNALLVSGLKNYLPIHLVHWSKDVESTVSNARPIGYEERVFHMNFQNTPIIQKFNSPKLNDFRNSPGWHQTKRRSSGSTAQRGMGHNLHDRLGQQGCAGCLSRCGLSVPSRLVIRHTGLW